MSRLHRLALIALVTLVALAALGCGPRASTSMSVAEQQLLCAPIAEHAAGTFACRADEAPTTSTPPAAIGSRSTSAPMAEWPVSTGWPTTSS